MPGIALADYQAETQAFKALFDQLRALVAQLKPLLQQLDTTGQPLDAKNKAALKTLRGLLQGGENEVLLDQITGPGTQSSPAPPVA